MSHHQERQTGPDQSPQTSTGTSATRKRVSIERPAACASCGIGSAIVTEADWALCGSCFGRNSKGRIAAPGKMARGGTSGELEDLIRDLRRELAALRGSIERLGTDAE